MTYDIVQRDSAVLVIDGEETVHRFEKSGDTLVPPEEVPDEILDVVQEELCSGRGAEYSIAGHDIDFPVRVKTGHHLKKEVSRKVEREIDAKIADVFTDMVRVNIPSIETSEHWVIDENGNAELERVEYNGVSYTPDS